MQRVSTIVQLYVNLLVYGCVVGVLVSAGCLRTASICGNLSYGSLWVNACLVAGKTIAAEWQRLRVSRGVASSRQPSPEQLTQLRDVGEVCAICLGSMITAGVEGVLLTPCGHAFHRICLITWFKVCSTCPMCRRRM
jgi:hypothetical protein